MIPRVIGNDLRRRPAMALTTTAFVAAATMLVSLAAILVVNLSGAIDTLMTRARTPHFMQMHSGPLHMDRLTAFAEHNAAVADFQVAEFLNVDGGQIAFERGTLADSVQDNGFAVQGDTFDLLLDLAGNRITVSDGQIYVPVYYLQDGSTRVGEVVKIAGKELRVAGFLRDSQMNSPLASSKRFLVSRNDFAALEPAGRLEYLIEFRLEDVSMLSAFEAEYVAAGLDANGPTVTYPLFRMANAISDGMVAAVILLVAALVMVIAFLCIRLTLLAKIEEDYREIGVMKAIGLRVSDIRRIYLASYAALAAVGNLIGLALSWAFQGLLLENIRLTMGASDQAGLAVVVGSLGGALLVIAIMAYVSGLLRQVQTISPAESIRFGVTQTRPSRRVPLKLSDNGRLDTNVYLGLQDVLTRKNQYVTMMVVIALAMFIIIVPQNVHSTFASPDFVGYLGIGRSDLRIDVQQTDDVAADTWEIAQAMADDPAITRFVVLTTRAYPVRMPDGEEERLTVELGDHSVFPIHYVRGRAPAPGEEIALSVLSADAWGLDVGDAVTLIIDGRGQTLSVCGIYSDVTNGGKTAKAAFGDNSAEIMRSVINAELADNTTINTVVAAYARAYGFAKVSGIDTYVSQTFGGTQRAALIASRVALAVGLGVAGLITWLFMRMLLVKDRYGVAVLKAIGFTNADVRAQFVTRSMVVLVAGVLIGTLLANTVGATLAGAVITAFGAAAFEFTVSPWLAYGLAPTLMTCVVLVATVLGTLDAGYISITDYIKE